MESKYIIMLSMFFIIGMFFIQATKYIYRHRTRDSFIFVNKMFNHFFYIEDIIYLVVFSSNTIICYT